MSSAPSSPPQMVRSNSNSPPTQVLPPPPPPIDLRHMTSNQGLSSSSAGGRRTSQHFLRTNDTRGLGSPNSIPSSPTSIHSSSSAIFERDIEPILISPSSPPHSSSLFGPPPIPLSPPAAPGATSSSSTHPHVTSVGSTHSSHSPHKPVDPHRIPRAKATEQLEQSVPSVLDSAAAILANMSSSEVEQMDAVQVVAPGSLGFAGFDSLILGGGGPTASSFASGGSLVSPGGASIGQGRPVGRGTGGGSGFASPLSLRSRSPSPGTRSPSGAAAPVQGLLNIPSPVVSPHVLSSATATSSSQPQDGKAASPAGSPRLSTSPPLSASTNTNATATTTTTTSHPPSPTHAPTKRLSFMSYSDLLSSTPSSMHTLASLTTSASTFEPPPHIPGVSGLNIVSAVAASVGSASQSVSPSVSVSKAGSVRGVSVGGPPQGGLTHPGMRESIALLDNVGGEWEREGMGKGLEERLEELSASASAGGSPLSLRGGLPNVNVVTGGQGKEVEVGKA